MKKLMMFCLILGMALGAGAKNKSGKNNNDSGAAAATATISGVITDSVSGEQLAGVEVKIEGTDTKTYTDFDGNFSFKGMVPGEYKLVTTYISYEKTTEALKTDASDNLVRIRLVNSK